MQYDVFRKLQSQNFVKVYDLYDSRKYIAVVYEALPERNLAEQI